jgi:hypothetical protein
MAKTKVTNISGIEGAVTLPSPYNRVLGPGKSVVIADLPATVRANLGGAAAIASILDLSEVPDTVTTDIAATGPEVVARVFTFSAPAAPDNTGVHAALAGTAAVLFPGPITNPAIPRSVRAVFAAAYDGGDITIVGTNQFDEAQTETIVAVANSTVAGVKIWKTITSITKGAVGANGATVSIGQGSKLGLPQRLASGGGLLMATVTPEAVTVDTTNHAITTTTAPNGAVVFTFIGNV